MVKYRYMQRGVLQALNPLSNCVTFTAIVPGAYPGESKIWFKKTLIHFTRTVENQSLATDIAISQKWLKLDGCMQHLPRLSQGRQKCAKCVKMANF